MAEWWSGDHAQELSQGHCLDCGVSSCTGTSVFWLLWFSGRRRAHVQGKHLSFEQVRYCWALTHMTTTPTPWEAEKQSSWAAQCSRRTALGGDNKQSPLQIPRSGIYWKRHFKIRYCQTFLQKNPCQANTGVPVSPTLANTAGQKCYLLVIPGIFLVTSVVRLSIFSNTYRSSALTLRQTACPYSLSFFLLTCSPFHMLDIKTSSVIHVAYAFFHTTIYS